MSETKICTKCGRELEATTEYFSKAKKGKYGLKSICKKCACQEDAEYRAKKKELKMQNSEIIPEGMKKCTRCQQIKPATTEYFNNKKSGKYGLTGRCKECLKVVRQQNSEREKERNKLWREENKEHCKQYREENKEHINEYHKQYDETHKEQKKEYYKKYRYQRKEMLNELGRQKYYENIEYEQQRSRNYYKNNKEKHRISVKNWLENNKKLKPIYWQRRRTLLNMTEVSLTLEQWEQIKKDFNNRCCYCNEEKPLTIDHFIPLSKMGELTTNNVVPACQSCNSSKNNKLFSEWYPKQSFYSKEQEKKILDYLNYKDGNQQLTLAI